MFSVDLLANNLLSPVVLAFALGIIARGLRSDLEIPSAIQSYLSIFLLLAIGLKGGVALRKDAPENLPLLIFATLTLGILTATSAFFLARAWLRDNRIDAAAIAAHFGSVSAVTFIAAQQFSERNGQAADSVLVALVVAMEIPAILIGLALAKGAQGIQWHNVREVLTGKTALLLLGGMAIGALSNEASLAKVDAMYFQLFQGTLMLFMLDMGMIAAGQLRTVGSEAFRLGLYSTVVPLAHGVFGVWIGHLLGMNSSTSAVFGTMAASASYIAAPASIRASLPEANVGRCITAALGFTFPFNLAIGIPVYFTAANYLAA
ncbi:MAG: sodium-dependent bicarbonate transport family permease [Arenimonas sp.]|nr:sodium-dependent bicarbonate transport family permease [Arenimonas sp.]